MEIQINRYGFYEVVNKPTELELKEYYSKKYYQEGKGTYQKSYSEDELKYFQNKISQKVFVLEREFSPASLAKKSLLDIGSGEGWVLHYFKKKGWRVTGIDFSDHGCRSFNPDCLVDMMIGDIYESIHIIKRKATSYSVIWLDNVLEHVTNTFGLLSDCREMIDKEGALVIEVPNDYSPLQQYLLQRNYVNSEFWVALPDHLSYFNKNGLLNLAREAGWESVFVMADFPIDFSLVNPDTNYVNEKVKGKNCNRSRVEIDNLMHSISVEKTVAYYRALADLGLGRQIIAFFKPVN